MGFRKEEFIIAKCDHCGSKFESGDGGVCCFNNKDEAKKITRECEWTIKNGKLFCEDCYEESLRA